MEGEGRPRVTDFGLVRPLHGEMGLTRSQQVLGTPAYLPGEVARGEEPIDWVRVDVYGLGALLYTTLSGRAPAQGRNSAPLLRAASGLDWPAFFDTAFHLPVIGNHQAPWIDEALRTELEEVPTPTVLGDPAWFLLAYRAMTLLHGPEPGRGRAAPPLPTGLPPSIDWRRVSTPPSADWPPCSTASSRSTPRPGVTASSPTRRHNVR